MTNYKVMFSSFCASDELEEVGNKAFFIHVIRKRLGIYQGQFYLMIRNPKQRLESFFKNKFRSNPQRERPLLDEASQRIFYPYLGIDTHEPEEVLKQKFLNFKYKDFILLLPELYQKDSHLLPQSLALYAYVMRNRFKLEIPYDRIMKMESAEDLEFLADNLSIDLERKNSTKDIPLEGTYTDEMNRVIQRIYRSDFALFNS